MPTTNRTRPLSEQWKTSSSASAHVESWKMSGKPRHAQLSATPINHNSPWQPTKPLPPEPVEPFFMPAMEEPTYYHSPLIHSHHSYPNYTYTTLYDMASQPPPPPAAVPPLAPPAPLPPIDYQQQQQQQIMMDYPQQQQQQQTIDYISPSSSMEYYSSQPSLPNLEEPVTTEKPKKNEKKIRQITVQSINAEHRVWIDVLPSETGLSLAEKIHVIATFRTRKVVSITTASGRKITLDNRPVFGSWMEMENFEDGERWAVEWRENDRGMVDKLLSKMIQVKRKKS